MKYKTDKITALLKDKKIKPSIQRIIILNYLVKRKDYPTIDIIFKDLQVNIPTLSKTTVYNTLKLFHENDLVNAINTGNNEVRYSVNNNLHGHFECKECGNIYNFNVNSNKFIKDSLNEFSIEKHHIYVKGICKKCNKR